MTHPMKRNALRNLTLQRLKLTWIAVFLVWLISRFLSTALLNLHSENQTRFFSFTRTTQETSLLLEEDALADFPPFSLTIVKTQWRALSVSLGSVGYSTFTKTTLVYPFLPI